MLLAVKTQQTISTKTPKGRTGPRLELKRLSRVLAVGLCFEEFTMPNVTIYTRQMCGFCSRAKRLLADKGVAFMEIDATFDQTKRAEMMQRANGARTFPQIFIGDTHVGGCDDLVALERAGKLDPLLAA